jgi:adenylate kinase family enzyme
MDLNDFPVFKTKMAGVEGKYNLNTPEGRAEYFQAKAGPEIEKLRTYLSSKTFLAFLLGKKNSGKGTYSKLFMEAVGGEHVSHISVGDLVRDTHKIFESGEGKDELVSFLQKNYRGFHTIEEIQDIVLGRSQSNLISSELILALIKFEAQKNQGKAIFLDGFPRALDQVGYSMFLKEMVGFRNDPDFLIFINVPNSIIDERIKYRVICPACKTPRNLKLLATSEVGWDEEQEQFYLKCDNVDCTEVGTRMVGKEGDELGIDPIRERIELDNKIFQQLLQLQGVDKIYLRNSVPVDMAQTEVDNYELTPAYSYVYHPENKTVETVEQPWTVKDDNNIESYSFLPAAVVLSLIKQMSKVLGL